MEKFDLKPFDKVLVRDEDYEMWNNDLYGFYDQEIEKNHVCIGGYWTQCIPYNDETKHLLGTTNPYEEPYEPKDGDFVTYIYPNGNKYVAIYKRRDRNLIDNYYADLCLANNVEKFEKKFSRNNGFEPGFSERRQSTEEEKQLLLKALHEADVNWDYEKKEIVDRWKPTKGEYYWSVFFSPLRKRFISLQYRWLDGDVDISALKNGWVYKMQEEADKLAEELNEKLF